MLQQLDKLWQHLRGFLLAITLMCLPVTSFPFFPGFSGTQVRPLAIYPLLFLLVMDTVPSLWRRQVPRREGMLFLFALFATLVSILAIIFWPPSNQPLDDLLGRLLRNLITLCIGVSFYLAISLASRDENGLRRAWRWVYAGFGVAFLWSVPQILGVLGGSSARVFGDLAWRLQQYVSVIELPLTRIAGMASEPNWYAEQITMILLPGLAYSALSGFSVFSQRWRWLTVERLMLPVALLMLVMTFSRAGLIMMAGVIFLAAFLFFPLPESWQKAGALARVWIAGAGTLVLVAGMLVAGAQNAYFARLFEFNRLDSTGQTYLEFVAIDQRLLYADIGMHIYNDFPVLGVGLGNYGFWFEDYLPRQPYYSQPEVITLITPRTESPVVLNTPKNLYVRLLAETGIIGFSVYMVFYLVMFGLSLRLARHPDARWRPYGAIGLLGMTVVMVAGFNYDSFALLNQWLVLGMLSAAGRLADQATEQAAGTR